MAKKPWQPSIGNYDEMLDAAKKRVPVTASVFFNEIPKNSRKFAFTTSLVEKQSQVKSILDSLNASIEEGSSFENWKNSIQLEKFKSLADFRKEALFRTHMQTAYNQGQYKVASELKKQVPYLLYSAVLDDRTRPNHEALNGIIRPVDDDFWDTHLPPNGINCRCEVVSVGKGDELEDAGGLTSGKKLDEAILNGKPDKGFSNSKLSPNKNIDSHFRKRNKVMPKPISESFLERFIFKNKDADIWWEKNKSLFQE